MKFLAFTSAITIASLVGCCSALIAPQKRATTKALGEIYAYGTNISGSQVFVDNGIAYIGDSTAMDGAMNVTCKSGKKRKHTSQPASQPFLHISTVNRHRSLTLERNLPNHPFSRTNWHRNLCPQTLQKRHRCRQRRIPRHRHHGGSFQSRVDCQFRCRGWIHNRGIQPLRHADYVADVEPSDAIEILRRGDGDYRCLGAVLER